MKVDLVASLPHYLAHTLPIWAALPDELRGRLYRQPLRRPTTNIALVGGWHDAKWLTGVRKVYVEHGAGQTYTGSRQIAAHPSYSGHGGTSHDGVIGYIAPSATVANRWTTAPSLAVGCPKMDEWHSRPSMPRRAVAIAFHWAATVCPEAGTALPYYRPHLPAIVDALIEAGFEVYGHAHPRAAADARQMWSTLGVPFLEHDADVFRFCSGLIADNTSLLYEFASLDRPVVCLNAPWYRRDVEHGLRFWSLVPGTQVDEPDDLVDVSFIRSVFDVDAFGASGRRADVIADVYEACDGGAAQRAAAFITAIAAAL